MMLLNAFKFTFSQLVLTSPLTFLFFFADSFHSISPSLHFCVWLQLQARWQSLAEQWQEKYHQLCEQQTVRQQQHDLETTQAGAAHTAALTALKQKHAGTRRPAFSNTKWHSREKRHRAERKRIGRSENEGCC